jgi:branched-chain amino acid transport system substrate-binding protein
MVRAKNRQGGEMKRRKWSAMAMCFIVLLGLTVVIAACGSSSGGSGSTASTSASKDPIIIGAPMGFTGFMVTWDGPVYAAAQLAVDDINAAGGVLGRQLKLVKADTKSDPAVAPLATSQVLDSGAQAVIVSTDFDAGSPAALVAQSQHKISSSGAVSPKFGVQGVGDMAYSFSDSSTTEAAVGAQFAFNKGWKTAYTLTDVTVAAERDFSQYFAEAFTHLGGKVLAQDVFKNDDQSIAAQITHFKSLNPQPDVMVLASYAPGGPAALRQIRAAGINVPVVGADDWDGVFWLDAVPGVKDVYGIVPNSQFRDDPDSKVNEFFARLSKSLGKEYVDSSLAIGGYCWIQVYANAVKTAGTTDPAAVKKALDSTTDFPALSGLYTYTAQDHILYGREMTVIGFSGGTGHFIERTKPTYVPPYKF